MHELRSWSELEGASVVSTPISNAGARVVISSENDHLGERVLHG